jgi:hypothetical protein
MERNLPKQGKSFYNPTDNCMLTKTAVFLLMFIYLTVCLMVSDVLEISCLRARDGTKSWRTESSGLFRTPCRLESLSLSLNRYEN